MAANDMLKYEKGIQVSSCIYAVSASYSYLFFMWWIWSILTAGGKGDKLYLLIRFWWLHICMMNLSLFFSPLFLCCGWETADDMELNMWFMTMFFTVLRLFSFLEDRSDFSGVLLELLGSTWAQMTLLSTGQTKLNHSSLGYKCICCECVPSDCLVLCDRSPAWIVPAYTTHHCVVGDQTVSLKCIHSSKDKLHCRHYF